MGLLHLSSFMLAVRSDRKRLISLSTSGGTWHRCRRYQRRGLEECLGVGLDSMVLRVNWSRIVRALPIGAMDAAWLMSPRIREMSCGVLPDLD